MRATLPSNPLHSVRRSGSGASRGSARSLGFTLVELVVVLGIILLMLGFAAPSVVGILKGRKIEQALSAVSAVLEKARMDATVQNTYIWAGLLNVDSTKTTSGQDELWIMTFKGKTGESRVPSDPTGVLPTSALQRVEGVSMVPLESLPKNLTDLVPKTSVDFQAATPSKMSLTWQGVGKTGQITFNKLLLFTPRGEALLEDGVDQNLPVPQPHFLLGLSRTVKGKVVPAEKDLAAVLVAGITGRVTSVRP